METLVKSSIDQKVLVLDELIRRVEELKSEGKIVVQSHGIFDLIHPGIIAHLGSAKSQGDILVVTVIKDKDVRRGPGRPIFPDNLRAENVASLEQVDYVCVVDDDIPFACVKLIKPDIFAKGQAYKDRDRKIHDKIFEEEREFHFGRSKIYETSGFTFSSSEIINRFLDVYSPETRQFIRTLSEKYCFNDILERLNTLRKTRVLLIGEGFIDEYHYCEPIGKSSKAHLVVNKYLAHEIFVGGAFAIANHISCLCDDVQIISLLGNDDSKERFIMTNLKPNVRVKLFYRDDGPAIVKKRYINSYLNQKIFEINYLNDNYINEELESTIIKYLEGVIPSYDVVLVSDFGHGFITDRMIKVIEQAPVRFAVNTQTNGANAGYNLITKYHNPIYVVLDEPEVRLAARKKYDDIESIARSVAREVGSEYFVVTRGRHGSIGIDREGNITRTPVLSTKVVDTVGAGDAFFAYTVPCIARGVPIDLACFIGNAVGALACQIVCNKKPVEKHELLEFIHALLK